MSETLEIDVIKRNGTLEPYQTSRVFDAIWGAWANVYKNEVDTDLITGLIIDIELEIESGYEDLGEISVREIESIIEETLIINGYANVAQAYADYRIAKASNRAAKNSIDAFVDKLSSDEVTKENANKDSRLTHVMRDRMAAAVAKSRGLAMLPERVRVAHEKGQIHIHDLDYSPYLPMNNCSIPDFAGMLEFGFSMGIAELEQPKSVDVACSHIEKILLSVSSAQYGGITVGHLDTMLEPYAEMTYQKELAKATKLTTKLFGGTVPNTNLTNEAIEETAKENTRKEIYDAIQALWYNINTTTNTSGQTPFVSIGFGLGRSWLAREIQFSILSVHARGLGKKGRTPIFPKLIFALQDGLNLKESDPNYDVKLAALDCAVTKKRIYPDIINVPNIEKITGDFKFPMGCVSGTSVVSWMKDGMKHTGTIEKFWLDSAFDLDMKTQADGVNHYIDLEPGTMIADSSTPREGQKWTPCLRVIRNLATEWVDVDLDSRFLTVTPDHPFITENRGVVKARDLKRGDVIPGAQGDWHTKGLDIYKDGVPGFPNLKGRDAAWVLGLLLGHETELIGGSQVEVISSYLNEESAIKLKSLLPGAKVSGGDDGYFTEALTIENMAFHNFVATEFGGVRSNRWSVPSAIFAASRTYQLAFLKGFDAGYGVNEDSGAPHTYLFDNEALAQSYLLISEASGYPAALKVEDVHMNGSNQYSVQKVELPESRHDRFKVWGVYPSMCQDRYSYDVTTASERFDVNGIVSHNCRSFLNSWENPETGEREIYGRGNWGVGTINLPRIALETTTIARFWKLLDSRLEIMHELIRLREASGRSAPVSAAPILFKHGGFARLPEDGVTGTLMDNHRNSLSFGYTGLYEVAVRFFGERWEHNPVAKDFTLEVLRRINAHVKHWNETDLSGENGGIGAKIAVYGTPSESLTDRFARLDLEKFGPVPGITDKGNGRVYYNNSFHLDSRLGLSQGWTPFDKLDFEKDYAPLSAGGFIHFTEWPDVSHNPKAVEALWDYSYHNEIGYMGINFPIDRCFECGFSGEFAIVDDKFTCPTCGNTGKVEDGFTPESVSVVRRVCGYLSEPAVRSITKGRQDEIAGRGKHVGNNDFGDCSWGN